MLRRSSVMFEAIEPGTDFVDAIDRALSACKIMLVLIGPRWLVVTDPRKQRRLDNPNDWIRLETSKALKRKIRVIPVLVEGASPPAEEDLPEDLKPLARREAHELSDRRWDYDARQLAAAIERVLGVQRKSSLGQNDKNAVVAKHQGSSKVVKTLAWVGGVFLLLLVLSAMFQQQSGPPMPIQPIAPVATGFNSGAPTSACGCWGFVNAGVTRPNPLCASGYETPRMCPGVCPLGGPAWQSVCM